MKNDPRSCERNLCNCGNPQLTKPSVGGFEAQLVGASHRYCEVTGSNPVEDLNFFRLLYAIA